MEVCLFFLVFSLTHTQLLSHMSQNPPNSFFFYPHASHISLSYRRLSVLTCKVSILGRDVVFIIWAHVGVSAPPPTHGRFASVWGPGGGGC